MNDKAFTESPYSGYEIYFEKLMAYGFFPSFFSVDASNDPYWQDKSKIENGRPFFKKYIPVIKQIAEAGWQPVTGATCNQESIRIERFGQKDNLFFTVRNSGNQNGNCILELDFSELGVSSNFTAYEMIDGQSVKVDSNHIYLNIPAGRTRVIRITNPG